MTLVLWIKLADDVGPEELALIKDSIMKDVEDNDSGAVQRADFQEDKES